jgi:hypothetical protein
MEPMPFSCTRTRKSSSPRSTGRDAPGASPAEVAPGRVKNRLPKFWLCVAWICALLMVPSDGGGWNADGAGCPAVVVVGVVSGVGVGVGRGGGAAVVRAGAAGFAVAARGRCGAVTVTVGTGTVPGGAACGVSGAACGVCGVVVGACGVLCGAGEVSDAGGVVVCGGSGVGDGVCDDAAPAKHSATSAELLRSSKRLLLLDMITPRSMTERSVSPEHRCTTAKRRRGVIGSAIADARRRRHLERCQARGGARAPRGEWWRAAANSNSIAARSSTRPNAASPDKVGASEGVNVPAR